MLSEEEFNSLSRRFLHSQTSSSTISENIREPTLKCLTPLNKKIDDDDSNVLQSIEKIMLLSELKMESSNERKKSIKAKQSPTAKCKNNMSDEACQVEIVNNLGSGINTLLNTPPSEQLGGKGNSSSSEDSDDVMDEKEYQELNKKRRQSKEGTSHVYNIEDIFSFKYKKEIDFLKARNDDLEQENVYLKESEDFLETELNKLRQSMSEILKEIRKSKDDKGSIQSKAFNSMLNLSSKEKDEHIKELTLQNEQLKKQLDDTMKKMVEYRASNTELQFQNKMLGLGRSKL